MATDIRELQGLRALVTGGTKGIGHAVAVRLHESGATMVTTARIAPDDSSVVDFVAAVQDAFSTPDATIAYHGPRARRARRSHTAIYVFTGRA